MALLKAGNFPDEHADERQHRFTHSLLPHGGDWCAGEVTRRAYELNVPLAVNGNQVHFDVRPFEVKTLRGKLDKAAPVPVALPVATAGRYLSL